MKILLVYFFLFFSSDEKFLKEIPQYENDSYFKQKVYSEHNWQSFYQLKEANAKVNPENYDYHFLNAAFFFATNKQREKSNKPALKFSAALRDAACVHTHQMIEKNFFDHYNSRKPKLYSPEKRMALFGIKDVETGENCDLNYVEDDEEITYIQLAEKIVDDFYHSPGHKKNMLRKSFSYLGCAVEFELSEKKGAWYFKATQDFCSR